MQLFRLLFVVVLFAAAVRPIAAQSDPDRTAFLEWAEMALVPVELDEAGAWREDFDRIIAGATIVALAEGSGADSWLFRNAAFRYLVEAKGFTAIAIESGVVEGRIVHDYVRGGPGEIGEVLSRGISPSFNEFPQNEALIRWMKEYNADAENTRKIDFYGIDIAGWPPTDSLAPHAIRTALDAALDYLTTVDTVAAASLRERLGSFMTSIGVDLRTGGYYNDLNQAERDLISGAISDLVSVIAGNEARYTAASSAMDYQWGYRAAIGARQADSWLRRIPFGYVRSRSARGVAEYSAFRDDQDNLRDRFQADNLEWVMRQQGPSGKILVFASNAHLNANPTRGPNEVARDAAGTHLRHVFGDQLVTIGYQNGGGEAGCGDFSYTEPPPSPGSISALVGSLDDRNFLLDLRAAPAQVKSWIGRTYLPTAELWNFSFRPGAFDVLFYVHEIVPACPR